jgi:hypothetical protein
MYRSHAGDMGPVSLVVSCQQKLDFSPTAPLAVVGEKLGTDPRIGQPACCELCREPFFSGAVDLFKSGDDCMKDCHIDGSVLLGFSCSGFTCVFQLCAEMTEDCGCCGS